MTNPQGLSPGDGTSSHSTEDSYPVCPRCGSDARGMKFLVEPNPGGYKTACAHEWHGPPGGKSSLVTDYKPPQDSGRVRLQVWIRREEMDELGRIARECGEDYSIGNVARDIIRHALLASKVEKETAQRHNR